MKPTTTVYRFWTYGHRPFVMGGSVNYILASDLVCTGPHKLGKGYSGYLASSQEGKSIVCEATTGAIVGNSLEDVRSDIKAAKPSVMREQIASAQKDMEDHKRHMSFQVDEPSSFWRTYNNS